MNEWIGKTGAGLSTDDIAEDSKLWNVIGECTPMRQVELNLLSEREKARFPWWERLHGFWRTLPNFNPFTVTSGHGQDIAEDAQQQLLPKASKSLKIDMDDLDTVPDAIEVESAPDGTEHTEWVGSAPDGPERTEWVGGV